jgi:lipoprotein-releasing system ATP-binding protein
MSQSTPLLSARGVTKSYFKGRRPAAAAKAAGPVVAARTRGGIEVPVLLGVDLDVAPGEFVSVVGTSGCGKSTLLHLLGTLDRPDSGAVYLQKERIDNLHPRRRDRLRNSVFGFIFQFYHLLPELDATENVLAPLMIQHGVFSYWRARRELRRRAEELLDRVGIGHRLHHKPNELSGGEMQRAAIARALVNRPQILLADEPTGNLDADSGRAILQILTRLNREDGLTIIMVTHDAAIAERADRIVRLAAGRVDPLGDPLGARVAV